MVTFVITSLGWCSFLSHLPARRWHPPLKVGWAAGCCQPATLPSLPDPKRPGSRRWQQRTAAAPTTAAAAPTAASPCSSTWRLLVRRHRWHQWQRRRTPSLLCPPHPLLWQRSRWPAWQQRHVRLPRPLPPRQQSRARQRPRGARPPAATAAAAPSCAPFWCCCCWLPACLSRQWRCALTLPSWQATQVRPRKLPAPGVVAHRPEGGGSIRRAWSCNKLPVALFERREESRHSSVCTAAHGAAPAVIPHAPRRPLLCAGVASVAARAYQLTGSAAQHASRLQVSAAAWLQGSPHAAALASVAARARQLASDAYQRASLTAHATLAAARSAKPAAGAVHAATAPASTASEAQRSRQGEPAPRPSANQPQATKRTLPPKKPQAATRQPADTRVAPPTPTKDPAARSSGRAASLRVQPVQQRTAMSQPPFSPAAAPQPAESTAPALTARLADAAASAKAAAAAARAALSQRISAATVSASSTAAGARAAVAERRPAAVWSQLKAHLAAATVRGHAAQLPAPAQPAAGQRRWQATPAALAAGAAAAVLAVAGAAAWARAGPRTMPQTEEEDPAEAAEPAAGADFPTTTPAIGGRCVQPGVVLPWAFKQHGQWQRLL